MKKYKPYWAKEVLPRKRCWCLLKLNNTYQPFAIAQWDPAYKEGSWILSSYTRDVLQPEISNEYIDWFILLEE